MVTGDEAQEAAAEGRLVGGRYRLDERLGSGGMGTVWAGHDLLVRREVAVKQAHTAHDPARVERVLREARAAARVNHPGVVTVHDIVIEDGHPWIVMERVRGESLADRLDREGVLPEREAARVALRVVEALTAAHERDVLHRDVKPANVLLREDGGVVLTDFGIAYITGEKPLTQTGEFVGSLAYTAPERMGGRRPEPASDLWSLGVLLFQMVEGWSPFHRESMEETVTAVVVDETPPTRRADALAPVVHALLSKSPDDRPSSAEVAELLRAAAERPAEEAAGQTSAGAAGQNSVAERSAAENPVAESPVGENPVAESRKAEKPVGEEPVAQEVAADEGGPSVGADSVRPVPATAGPSADVVPVTGGARPEVPGSGRRSPGPSRGTVRRRLLAAAAACVLLGSLGAWALTQWNDGTARSGASGPGSHGKATTSSSPAAKAEARTTATPGTKPPRPQPVRGYRLVEESGFQAEVPAAWSAAHRNAQGQYRYTQGDLELVIVPGRDTTARFSDKPIVYQEDLEPELAPWRASSWSSASGMRVIEVGATQYATGDFTWADDRGRELFVRNAAVLIAGSYHLVIVIGPESRRDEVGKVHDHVLGTYRRAT
ncbi:protein kinase [Streptomyces sp. NPDC127092]|uniref:serine/threonine-protein kinase n=1 Tax=Streptomyces sp. NPDC127092 TaxID=3347135 RepID=UPI003648D257